MSFVFSLLCTGHSKTEKRFLTQFTGLLIKKERSFMFWLLLFYSLLYVQRMKMGIDKTLFDRILLSLLNLFLKDAWNWSKINNFEQLCTSVRRETDSNNGFLFWIIKCTNVFTFLHLFLHGHSKRMKNGVEKGKKNKKLNCSFVHNWKTYQTYEEEKSCCEIFFYKNKIHKHSLPIMIEILFYCKI